MNHIHRSPLDRTLIWLRSTDNFGARKRTLWMFLRNFVSRERRFFIEGSLSIRGQLWYEERKLIYETLTSLKPQNCFEVGTWNGGGSTLFVAYALKANCAGQLHTIEIDTRMSHEAQKNYIDYLPDLVPFVNFHVGNYADVYRPLLESLDRVDLLFLDGPEDAQETLNQYNFFAPYLKRGSILMAHDWFTEKQKLLKPFIEGSADWTIKQILRPPASIGFAVAVKN